MVAPIRRIGDCTEEGTKMTDSIFPSGSCICTTGRSEGRLCTHLTVTTNISIGGTVFRTMTCNCENDMCATCIPEFYNPDELFGSE
jgi:hypothetical protein